MKNLCHIFDNCQLSLNILLKQGFKYTSNKRRLMCCVSNHLPLGTNVNTKSFVVVLFYSCSFWCVCVCVCVCLEWSETIEMRLL